jgi:phage baseplate assembly protein V
VPAGQPQGETTQALALVGLYSEANPTPAHGPTLHRRQYPDGAVIDYDHDRHSLTVTLPAGGRVHLTAPGGVTILGDVAITGALQVSGLINSDQDVTAAGISLVEHTHQGNLGKPTSPPQ